MSDNYGLLLDKINEFKQKFYLHKLIRGLLYFIAVLLALFLILFVSFYYAHPSVFIKTSFFVLCVTIAVIIGVTWVVHPMMGYFRLGRTISAEEAAQFIGNHFNSVKDKLLNTLQLHSLASLTPENNALILASIDQKIIALQPISFTNAINLNENKKYVKYILIPLSIIISIGLIFPSMLTEGSRSVIKFNQEILPSAPFNFILKNRTLTVTQGDDLKLTLKVEGNQIPQDIYLEDGANSYKLDKEGITSFSYHLKNLQKKQKIWFSGGGFKSKSFEISVLQRPAVIGVNAEISYPKYLNKPNEVVSNAGDLMVPEGTRVTWRLNFENTTSVIFLIGSTQRILPVYDNKSEFASQLIKSTGYKVTTKNSDVSNKDSISYQIIVIKDQFPSIEVKESKDSLSSKVLYFSGTASDDYGLSALYFCYNILQNGKNTKSFRQAISIKKQTQEVPFFYAWVIEDRNLSPGETLEYYFEVSDNDGINGPKTTRSATKTYLSPTHQLISDKINSGSELLKEKMESAIKLAETVEKYSKKLAEAMLDKKELTFEDKKEIESLLEKQQRLEKIVNEIKRQNDKNNFDKEESSVLNEELKIKQQQIDNLFKNVLNEKTKEFLSRLQRLMKENGKEQTQDQLSKMQMDNKSLKKELDRILELYKQLEFEQSLQFSVDRLKELAKQQRALLIVTQNKSSDKSNLKERQKTVAEDFNSLKNELKNIEKKDQALDHPTGFEAPEKDATEISDQQKKALEGINSSDTKNATEAQKNAVEAMENLAKKIESMQQRSQASENTINLLELRKLLEKLLITSFDQENTMLSLKSASPTDPLYISNVQKQRNIIDNMSIVGDSLFTLSKRVPQISSTVNAEMKKITTNMQKSLDNLEERRTSEANKFQQYTMTSVNNLALMLNEALDQLQQMQKNGSPGGNGKKGMKQLQQMQEQLNKQMQQAREHLEKNGNNGKVPKSAMSEEFAKMAQQQQLIRDALQKINRDDNKDGRNALGNLNQLISDMKQTESDLVNKKIEQETLSRQKSILTKLLDAETAQREQDQEEKREASAAAKYPPSYAKMRERFESRELFATEIVQKAPPTLQTYYRNIINEYYKKLTPKN